LNNYYVAAVAAATQNSYANGQSGSAYWKQRFRLLLLVFQELFI
jgi:hypothetical protein